MGEVYSHHNQKFPEFDEKDLERIEKLAGYGLTKEKIADVFGMHRNTFLNRYKKDPKLLEALNRGIARAEADVSTKAYEMAMSGDHPSMTMFWLKCRAKWKEVQKIEISKTTIEDLVNGAAQLEESRDVTPDKDKNE